MNAPAAAEAANPVISTKRQLAAGGKKLPHGAIELREHAQAVMSVTLPYGWDIKEVLRPEFWSNVAYRFQKDAITGRRDYAGSKITVYDEAMTVYGELIVVAVEPRGLKVKFVNGPVTLQETGAESDLFEVRWNIGKRGWSVYRKSDGEMINDGSSFPAKEDALEFIDKMNGRA